MVRTKTVSPFPKKFSDRQWGRFVRQGRDLVEEETRIQFALGDLALKMLPFQGRGGNQGVFSVLDRYADQIGSNVHTLMELRKIAHDWPPQERVPGVAWCVHRAFASLDDRFEVIHHPPSGAERWTEDAALSRAGRLPHRPLTKAEKLDRVRTLMRADDYATEAVEEMIRRPDVASQVMANPSNTRILYRAHHEQREQAASARFAAAHERSRNETEFEDTEFQDEDTEPEPLSTESDPLGRREPAVDYQRASREVLELIGSGTTFLVDLQRMIPGLHVSEFTEREVRAVLDNHRRIRAALDWCDSALSTGDKSMDDELARILSEGDDEP
ncbi:DUF6192 family protein [Streptomyces anulatus]|uniref:DUF6192 family protein n=1 Tax=Streptomyces anulatus TaxID=1892 RepID=UPI00341DA7DF